LEQNQVGSNILSFFPGAALNAVAPGLTPLSRLSMKRLYYALTDRWTTSRKREVYDCFIFFNELEILKLRLNELYNYVDKFVIVESTRTFHNDPKPLHYLDNKIHFNEFNDKIIYIIVDDMPSATDPWVNEIHQRNSISRGLARCRDYDIILVSDVDEIPNPDVIDYYKNNHLYSIKNLLQRLYYYFLNNLASSTWRLAYISSFCNIKGKDLNSIRKRKIKKKHLLFDGGWHFSYMGGVEEIIKKIESFSHTEYNTDKYKDKNRLIDYLNSGKDLFDREKMKFKIVQLDETYPRYILDNLEYYQKIGWIK